MIVKENESHDRPAAQFPKRFGQFWLLFLFYRTHFWRIEAQRVIIQRQAMRITSFW